MRFLVTILPVLVVGSLIEGHRETQDDAVSEPSAESHVFELRQENPVLIDILTTTITSTSSSTPTPTPTPNACPSPIFTYTYTSTTSAPLVPTNAFVTTQWVETWLDSTSRTWIPRTLTFQYSDPSPAPRPGKGEVGMGTLTGQAGRTQTVVVTAAGATKGVDWRGVVGVAAAGWGIIGV